MQGRSILIKETILVAAFIGACVRSFVGLFRGVFIGTDVTFVPKCLTSSSKL